jgi:hypothetical protein
MNEHNYDTWYYWFGFWQNEKGDKVNCSMLRTPQVFNMLEMTKQFIKNKPPMDYEPAGLLVGRAPNATMGRELYDNDDNSGALKCYLEKKFVDMCVTQLVKASSEKEARRLANQVSGYARNGTFDQLDEFLKNRKGN